ncbi:ComEA family DNA-binding protein [Halopseudomonas salegens]|uniref:Competence protein ComEA n=1 Tax=Halopseudomonas salegens TaxID=1434072 RepID=A0A1H2F327_9GAMM|nr:helix-hairpin-helix domain-containing protein [Halopseudomonas salegens]SDU01762.1 competence protein ComEA [Halopseudomonas salegens]
MKQVMSAIALCSALIFSSLSLAEQASLVSVNVNEASAGEIAEVLQGVGQAKAEAIVAYRDEHGPFTDAESLAAVSGVGPATIDNNRARIKVD